MKNKNIVIGSIILGVIFVAIAIYYCVTPAGSLATFVPGFEAGVTTIHFKHGLASLILGIGLFVLAWFKSGKKNSEPKAGDMI